MESTFIKLTFIAIFQLHSEYRSTYRWHEYTGGSRAEVIKKPPTTNQFGNFEFVLYLCLCYIV